MTTTLTTLFTTPRDLLRYAITRFNTATLFFGHGSAEALDEAAYLILHTLKLPLDKLDPFLDARSIKVTMSRLSAPLTVLSRWDSRQTGPK